MIEGRKVLYISLEMSEDKIAQRFDSIMTLVPQFKLKDPSNQLTVKERLELFQTEFPGSQLVIKEFPTGQATINTIRNLLVQLKNYDEFEPDLLIVDYLELLRPTRDIQQGRMVKIITDAELGDSYGKIRTCDFAMSLNQSEEEFDEGKMRAYVIKSRNGRPRFIVPMDVDYNILRMTEGDAVFAGDDS